MPLLIRLSAAAGNSGFRAAQVHQREGLGPGRGWGTVDVPQQQGGVQGAETVTPLLVSYEAQQAKPPISAYTAGEFPTSACIAWGPAEATVSRRFRLARSIGPPRPPPPLPLHSTCR
eukprot:803623-Pyramimonas_sp.AAC.1